MDSNCFGRRRKAPRTHSSATAMTPGGDKRPFLTFFRLLLTTLLLVLGASPAFAADPSHVNFTLEGCRNDGSITFPPGGPFVCPDAAYTTGNLGKGWNELDLVPHRVTAAAGNSAPSNQSYTIAVVADNLSGTALGYDVISVPVLNTALSSASCTAPTVGPQTQMSPGLGGLTASIYRLLTINQAQNTTCVYDYHERLALGSHLFPGSSLHSNLALQTGASTVDCSGLGCRDVSIPVKEILPQKLDKNMSAAQGGDQAWSLKKEANPAEVSFGDVCVKDAPLEKPVTITVTWTKVSIIPGTISVTANITATNPASRTITVAVSDTIYQGTTQSVALDTANLGSFDVPANSSHVFTHTVTLPSSDGNIGDFLNDVATATYTDKDTGITVPGNTSATAKAQITAGTINNSTVSITDTESITGTGLTFSVATPSVGSFTGGYIAGTHTVGPVGWSSGAQTDSGSVSFNKTIYLASLQVTSGVLSDSATLTGDNNVTLATAGPLNVNISSSASVALTIDKVIDNSNPTFLFAGDKLDILFHVTRANDSTYGEDVTISFTGGGATELTSTLTGLVPDNYTVVEQSATFTPAGSNTGQVIGLSDPSGTTKTKDLTLPNCSGTVKYNDQLLAGPASAQVQKITDPLLQSGDPDFTWTFTLQGPGLPPAGIQATANAGAGYVDIGGALQEGTFTMTETLKSGWQLDSATPNDGTTTTICSFAVNYPADAGKLFQCSFHNTKLGKATVVKTQSGAALTGTESFDFQLRQGASTTQAGTTLETATANAANNGTFTFSTLLVPGTHYQLCEAVLPGWQTSLSSAYTVFNPDGDNSVLCTDFTVAAGETKSFAVDNTPPPGGNARTIGFWKNWTASSCKQSNGKQAPVLDQTLALATPPGEQVGTLYLDGSSTDVCYAVLLLNKSDILTGKKMASNPLYGLAAQLLAAELNVTAGAAICPAVSSAITQANALLVKYGFNGTGSYSNLTKADATTANNLASKLDAYNNNLPSACQ
ncbi:hypothetical protein NH8B_3133 [Pseudogulbenkiania sp. NH8B]|nr:hypothetical protein NH8B_3133 [Pseudogulbenkiania sp. NH8B]